MATSNSTPIYTTLTDMTLGSGKRQNCGIKNTSRAIANFLPRLALTPLTHPKISPPHPWRAGRFPRKWFGAPSPDPVPSKAPVGKIFGAMGNSEIASWLRGGAAIFPTPRLQGPVFPKRALWH
jgi:hypothetical protein